MPENENWWSKQGTSEPTLSHTENPSSSQETVTDAGTNPESEQMENIDSDQQEQEDCVAEDSPAEPLQNAEPFTLVLSKPVAAILALVLCGAIFLVGLTMFTQSRKSSRDSQAAAIINSAADSLMPKSVAPLPDSMRVGAVYSGLPDTSDCTNDWYRIPDWLAGNWQQDSETEVSATGQPIKTEMARENFSWGQEQDRDHHCWISCRGGIGAPVEKANKIEHRRVTFYRVVAASDKSCVIQIRAISVDVAHGSIISSYRIESVMTFSRSPTDDSAIEVSGVRYFFDQNGKLDHSRRTISRATSVFSAGPNDPDRDGYDSFRAYLTSHGLANLVP